ncbi:hypothetical protein [Paraburkholderia guartelaensis]|nr:hypothetical protein [Paraburkholderia guartelaensis]
MSTLNVDFTHYWKLTRTAYFEHVSKARIEAVVSEAVEPQVPANFAA